MSQELPKMWKVLPPHKGCQLGLPDFKSHLLIIKKHEKKKGLALDSSGFSTPPLSLPDFF
jgi:hypothetical protein